MYMPLDLILIYFIFNRDLEYRNVQKYIDFLWVMDCS